MLFKSIDSCMDFFSTYKLYKDERTKKFSIQIAKNHRYFRIDFTHYFIGSTRWYVSFYQSLLLYIGPSIFCWNFNRIGLVLFSYGGYPIAREKGEKFSDDQLTTWAAFFIFMTVLIPTKFERSGGGLIYCEGCYFGGMKPIRSKGQSI